MELGYAFTKVMVDTLHAGGATHGSSLHVDHSTGNMVRIDYMRRAGAVWTVSANCVATGGNLDHKTLVAEELDLAEVAG